MAGEWTARGRNGDSVESKRAKGQNGEMTRGRADKNAREREGERRRE